MGFTKLRGGGDTMTMDWWRTQKSKLIVLFQATTVYTEQLLELHRGQGIEIYWRDNFQCPSEEEYKEMTIKSETLCKVDFLS